MQLKGKLLISGGRQRVDGHLLGEGKYYDKACLIKLDLETGNTDTVVSKENGGPNYPDDTPNQQFAAGCIDGDTLWLPTDTEILKYRLPDFTQLACYSFPCFHNIHSVKAFGNLLAVTSTGLDNVVLLDKTTGEIETILNTEGKDPWHRFDPEFDYRKIHSTRPHDSHPNYVFELENELWVTRCTQEDAVCLRDVTQRIDITGGDDISVHDGINWKDKLLFTRVDGYVVVCDPKTRQRIKDVDPFANALNRPRSWCRGLHMDGDLAFIGYSKLRKTKLKTKLKYLSQLNFKYGISSNALVVAYNFKTEKVERIYEMPGDDIGAIYGILPFNYE